MQAKSTRDVSAEAVPSEGEFKRYHTSFSNFPTLLSPRKLRTKVSWADFLEIFGFSPGRFAFLVGGCAFGVEVYSRFFRGVKFSFGVGISMMCGIIAAALLGAFLFQALRSRSNGHTNCNEAAESDRSMFPQEAEHVDFEYKPCMKVEMHKQSWRLLCKVFSGGRNGMSTMFPPPTINFYDVDARPCVSGYVALTIDDAPCKSRSDADSMVTKVRQLLDKFAAKATFFVISSFIEGHEASVVELLKAGHEIGNHGVEDRPYGWASAEEFEAMLLDSEAVCEKLRREAGVTRSQVRWFRAPQAKLTKVMTSVLHKHGFLNVFGDAYANDPWISDPGFLAEEILGSVQDGSIIILHMPETGFRRHCYVALRSILEELQRRKFQVVTLSTLNELACKSFASEQPQQPCTVVPERLSCSSPETITCGRGLFSSFTSSSSSL
jgi:peptidoglycan/xylan/chitin deacetylase (PgdA/CDA1 family)